MDVPNIADSDFKLPDDKDITCPKCKMKNKISASAYIPNFEPEIKDLVKLLHVGCKQGMFAPAQVFECYACGTFESLREKAQVKFKCAKCKNFGHLSTQYVPTYNKEIENLSANGQGYWLEWYALRTLQNQYKTDYGLKITTKGETIDADVAVLKDNLKIIIECKDSSDDAFLTKLPTIKKVADYFILATTSGLSDKAIRTARALLKKKFVLITPDEIENLPTRIKNLK
jgi:hypothetical protein